MKQILIDFISNYITLSEDEKNVIGALDVFQSIKKGTILLKEGDRSNLNYFVLKGCLRTYYLIDGVEKTTAFYTEMQAINPHNVIQQTASKYYISAVEDSIVSVSTPSMEFEMFEKFPKFESLCRILSEKLVLQQQMDLDEFKTSSPEQRYVSLIDKRPDLLNRVPQYQLASFLGITPQSLSRLRARLLKK